MAKKLIIVILDGWGQAAAWGGNAISLAKTPVFNQLRQKNFHCTLRAHGKFVGLPGNEMGNSEVGHLNIGTGRVVAQDSSIIFEAIEKRTFFQNPILLEAIKHAQKRNGNLHLMGLLSDGTVHANIEHLFALLDLTKQENFSRVYLHLFTDGRDSPPQSALIYLEKVNKKLQEVGFGEIATLIGRYYAMDRDGHWERTKIAYDLLVQGQGTQVESANRAVSQNYSQSRTDEFLEPIIIASQGLIKQGDSVIFFNFRADRSRQLATALMDKWAIPHLYFAGFVPYGYEQELKLDLQAAFPPPPLSLPLAEVLSQHRLNQLHIAESEKYAHVTYFFNGGREKVFKGEERKMIPSSRIPSYDQQPAMSAEEITKELLKYWLSKRPDFVVINYANPDMVGHTGNLKATMTACEVVDRCLNEVAKLATDKSIELIITADHGNAEQMINPVTNEPDTQHTTNPVPFIYVPASTDNLSKVAATTLNLQPSTSYYGGDGSKITYQEPIGILADVSPAILKILDLPPVTEMTGRSLV